MSAEYLRSLVVDHFTRAAGFDPAALAVEYVLNWGGFVNYSYKIDHAGERYHLKLSTSREDQEALRRWLNLGRFLEAYRAPPVVTWIDVGPAAGLLFPLLPGSPPPFSEAVVTEVFPVLRALNADIELAAALRVPESTTARSAYLASFHRRFNEDLAGIRMSRPPFVTTELVRWLENEVESLLRSVSTSRAFDEELTKPVHGDLWLNNILWNSPVEWYLLDWDEVRIGDPALDFATLTGPTALDLRPLKMPEAAGGVIAPVECDRLSILGRATLLDWVIDPLSDWIDAVTAPEHIDVVRAEKERVHKAALSLYSP